MYVTTDETPLAFEYNEMQDHVFNELPLLYQFIILAKGRRSGGTYGVIQYIIEKALDNKLSILWCDTIQKNLPTIYSRMFQPILSRLKPQIYDYSKSDHELQIYDSRIYFRSAERPESMEGFFFDILVLNEAGLILRGNRGRDLWMKTLYPMTVDRGAQTFFIGTPKSKVSRKNEDSQSGHCLYYELYEKGLSGHPDWISKKYDSYCNVEMLAREQITGHHNRGIELSLKDARRKAIEGLNEMANNLPYHIRAQEIYAEFIDKQEESIFHQHWFDVVDKLPEVRLHKQLIISMDTAFKANSDSDFSAAVVVLQTIDNHFYFIDLLNDKLEFPELMNESKRLYKRYPTIRFMLIEDKASGQSLIQVLQREGEIPVRAIKVSQDKLSRASATTPLWEQGRCHLLLGDWNAEFIDQHCAFNGLFDSPDDIIDATSQALNFLNPGSRARAPLISRKVIRNSSATEGYR